jgi:hypothetical protein
VGYVVAADGDDLVHTLKFGDCSLGNDDGVMQDRGVGGDAAELAGAQQIAGVGEAGGDTDGTGLGADGAVYEDDVPGLWVDLAVGEGQLKGKGVSAGQQVLLAALFGAGREGQVFLLTYGEEDLDGVDLRRRK